MSELIQVKNENLVTTSLIIAETFNKNHKNVVRKIESLIPQIEVGSKMSRLNLFEKSEYYDSQNRSQTMYYINRDGFVLLAMGFTGAEALEWKLKYIDAFNLMEQKLKASHALPDARENIARLILKSSRSQIQAIKELYPEYFYSAAPVGTFEAIVDKNTSYMKWLEDFGITAEWIGEFPTIDIYNNYARYCIENRYAPMGKKVFYHTLTLDFGLTRRQKSDGSRYFLTA